jgi:2-oxoisovalerate dehydrogenase E1 component
VPDPEADELIPFGKAAVRREGSDLTLVSIGLMVHRSYEVAEKLAGSGISVEVIDLRSIAPLDIETIVESVRKTGRLLIVDEDFPVAGIGAEISAQVTERAFDELDAPIRRLNGVHTPVPYSPPLEAAVAPNKDQIEAAIRGLVAE